MHRITPSDLCHTFHAAAGSSLELPAAGLAAELREYLVAGRSGWPQLRVSAWGFVQHVAARSRDGQLQPRQHAADLLLAYACSCRVKGAREAFEREHGSFIDHELAYSTASSDRVTGTRQVMLEHLLVGDAGSKTRPRIADYRGHDPLHSWVASTVATTLLVQQRPPPL